MIHVHEHGTNMNATAPFGEMYFIQSFVCRSCAAKPPKGREH